jgi:hypothetical protein
MSVLHQVRTQNFSWGGRGEGREADSEAIHNLYLTLKIMLQNHVVKYNIKLSATAFIYSYIRI